MADRATAEEKLASLRDLILNARSMPMSASCVINRNEVLAAIDAVIADLPDEIAEAQDVVEQTKAKIAEGQDEATKIVTAAREQAEVLARRTEIVRVAEQEAAAIKAEAEAEAAALRREADAFVDSRMAAFESVLHKTTSQVKTARARLTERSRLDERPDRPERAERAPASSNGR
jgi:cell division septum initiation protein DivIVA